MPDVETDPRSEAVAAQQPGRVAALVASFTRIGQESMRGLPFYNEALSVEAIGFERLGEGWLGALITPWFMNLMFVSDQPIPYAETANGEKRPVELPGGRLKFLCGGTEDFGMFHAHSIASP
ncbi:MAG: [NiFe]-hydrogenase assembly chaperone HybE, partial [Rhodoplanes sp.]